MLTKRNYRTSVAVNNDENKNSKCKCAEYAGNSERARMLAEKSEQDHRHMSSNRAKTFELINSKYF